MCQSLTTQIKRRELATAENALINLKNKFRNLSIRLGCKLLGTHDGILPNFGLKVSSDVVLSYLNFSNAGYSVIDLSLELV